MEAENGPTPRRGGPGLWGILTAAVAVVTVGLCGWYTLIFVNPYSPLNPLPPATVTPYPVVDGPTPIPGTVPADLATPTTGDPATPNPTAPQSAVSTLTPPPGSTQPPVGASTPTQTTNLGQPSPTAGTPQPTPTSGGDTPEPTATTGGDDSYPIGTAAPTQGYP